MNLNPLNLNEKRSGEKELAEHIAIFEKENVYRELFDKLPDLICIINKNRQIVFANQTLFRYLGVEKTSLYGKRPGEALTCQYSFETPDRCGTSESCQYCGAFLSIKEGVEGTENSGECTVHQNITGDAIELKVSSSPIVASNENFIVFTIADISDVKRKEVLERVFFHDIMNVASGMYGLAQILEMELPSEYDEYKRLMKNASQRLIDEINAQKQLISAEKGNLAIQPAKINSFEFINTLIDTNSSYSFAADSKILLASDAENFDFISDKTILGRVVSNLIKNALEAEYPSGKVIIGSYKKSGLFRIVVSNTKYMSRDIQLQIFKKSFSTKGVGRGIGTYSIKMFTEKYLMGKVSYETSPEKGTAFFLEYPLEMKIREEVPA